MGSSPPSRLPTDGEATTVESLMPATAARPPLTATACTTSTTPSWSSDTDPTTARQELLGNQLGRERILQDQAWIRTLRNWIPPPDHPLLRIETTPSGIL